RVKKTPTCKMGPWPLCQGPRQRPRLSLPARHAGGRPLCLERGAGASRLEGLRPFHAVVHREQMHRPQTGFHATSSEKAAGRGEAR
uniref:Uncharacterized protein n=1 Tax=Mola mola TaxID=94237 RepID=A0A3Q3W053_MOLML